MPACFTPRRFSSVTSQIAPSVTATPTGRLPWSPGSSFRSEPVNATAITGSDAQNRDPIAPGHQEPGEVAVAQPGVRVRTTSRRRYPGQTRERQAEANGADTHNDPGEDREQAI